MTKSTLSEQERLKQAYLRSEATEKYWESLWVEMDYSMAGKAFIMPIARPPINSTEEQSKPTKDNSKKPPKIILDI